MKIVVAINGTIETRMTGGHEVRIFELFNRLSNENEVHIVQIADNSKIWKKGNITIHNVKPFYGNLGKKLYADHYFLARYFYTLKVGREVKKIKPDLVDYNSWVFPLFKRRYKMVSTCALMPTSTKVNSFYRKLVYFIDLYLLKYKMIKADHLIFLSRQMQDRFQIFISKKGKNSDYVPNGVDETIFHPGDKFKARESNQLPLDKKIVFYCSRLEEHKRPFDFLESIKRLPENYIGLIAGKGPLSVDIEKWINGNNLNDRFILKGPVDKHKLSKFYIASDVVLYPGEFEIQPLVPQEAMACGTPVIVSNTLGNNEIVKDNENGLLFELGKIDEIVEDILFLEDNPEERSNYVIQGLKFMSVRNWNETSKLTLNVYKNIM